VGRSSFELARHCCEVIGIDASQSFIRAALEIRKQGQIHFDRTEEGTLTSRCAARVPPEIDRTRVHFEMGDALKLRATLGDFDVVLAANLLCRLRDPAKFLARLPLLVKPGGQLVLTTPCTWLEEFTPRANWLCRGPGATLDGLRAHLDTHFNLVKQIDLPFLIREHARKFQWSVAQGTLWKRHAG
jgi:putative 4-mercaptohistidine N1-methyltranferase